ncbi:FKBP-type peptidyl-prolyl cis-trans isomerase [Hymenobacter terrenus]|uniref:FKBP-type peptidyl-prolyl cis-trans isomerase n=1 Tax=Hymenobacter terrenus TaxID=1629124 RepID=UPI000695AB7F|nr:FKBP-type peptidyl-prolyl cis-trans isomerase [Hymenobacter terrenus]
MKFSLPAIFLRFALLAAVGTTGLLSTSCTKDAPEVVDYSERDQGIITQYLYGKGITTAQKQPSGLHFLPVVTNPNAKKITVGSTVSVLYTAHLLDAAGTVFDASSRRNNVPITFVVGAGRLIPGFEEGISLMHIGDKAELLLPSALAYGNSTANGAIPANSPLRFEVEVVDYTVVDDNLIQKYIADSTITGAQKKSSGLYYVPVVTNTAGVQATTGKTVDVRYTGKFMDGRVFDKSTTAPFTFVLGTGKVIPGWDEGIALMRKGEKAKLLIPSALAYGPNGAGAAIPPNTVIRFDVELVDVR